MADRKGGAPFSRRAAIFLALALGILVPQPSHGQTDPRNTTASVSNGLKPTPIPLSYEPSSVKKTTKAKRPDAGRAVIIAFGSLPFMAFYTDFAFDSVRFATNGFDLQYAPWPFKNQYSAAVSVSERFMRLGVALGASAVVGLLDLVLSR
jgi:hypothetical protein